MDKSTAIMDLVAGYDTYAEADELNVTAASDAPATSPACAVSAASSAACASAVSGASVSATYEVTC